MIRSLFRRGLRIGLVVGAILLLAQIFLRNPAPPRPGTGRPSRTDGPSRRPQQRTEAPATETGAPAATAEPPVPATTATTATATAATSPDVPTTTETAAWVEPEAGACPVTHPVKVKLASGIYHVPGGLAYDRTAPDRCYRDAAAADADGFRPSKR